jgi:3D-(3,5/4)-trihydroxycyclohexane-1,2-dione acylhydrolase (decyclizing)
MGCNSERVVTVHELEDALRRARRSDRTTVIALHTDAYAWTGGGAFWEVGVPEVSSRPEVQRARETLVAGLRQQRIGT